MAWSEQETLFLIGFWGEDSTQADAQEIKKFMRGWLLK
jgi:hypothetical protein